MGARDIATRAVERLKVSVQDEMVLRRKNATGNTSRRIEVLSFGGDETGEAALEADSNWKFVGNGRGPGKPPPIYKMRQWLQATGRTMSPYALAESIAQRGTLDYRLGNPNVFLSKIEPWENSDLTLSEVEFADYAEQQGLKTIDEVKF